MIETKQEFNDSMLSRLRMMATDNGNTWDLSPKDQAAIQYALDQIEELTDVLRSARCIAERSGADTAWARFSERIGALGIGSVTAKVFKVLPSDVEDCGTTETDIAFHLVDNDNRLGVSIAGEMAADEELNAICLWLNSDPQAQAVLAAKFPRLI